MGLSLLSPPIWRPGWLLWSLDAWKRFLFLIQSECIISEKKRRQIVGCWYECWLGWLTAQDERHQVRRTLHLDTQSPIFWRQMWAHLKWAHKNNKIKFVQKLNEVVVVVLGSYNFLLFINISSFRFCYSFHISPSVGFLIDLHSFLRLFVWNSFCWHIVYCCFIVCLADFFITDFVNCFVIFGWIFCGLFGWLFSWLVFLLFVFVILI